MSDTQNISLLDMQQAVSLLRTALADASDSFKQYVFKDEYALARSQQLVASFPTTFMGQMVVPTEPFDRALSVIKDNAELTVGPKRISIKSGSSTVWVPSLPYDPALYKFEMLEDNAVTLSDDLAGAIRRVMPFIETKTMTDWMNSVIFQNGYISGVYKGQVMATTHFPELEGVNMLMPTNVAKIILSNKTGVQELAHDENKFRVSFNDDSWVQSSKVSGAPPAKLMKMLEVNDSVEYKELTGDQVAALRNAVSFGADDVVITEKGVEGRTHEGDYTDTVKFDLGGIEQLVLTSRTITQFLSVATHWAPAVWPNPTAFKGDNMHGLISARSH